MRPHQQRVLDDFLRFAAAAERRGRSHYGRIVLPPRTGKTAIAACIARTLRKPATFVVPTRALVEQTVRELTAWLGQPVGALYSDAKTVLDEGTNVTTYSMLEQCPDDVWAPLGQSTFVFVDEAHHALTDSRLKLLESRFRPDALRIALTATPDYDECRTLCRFFPALIHELTLEEALDLGLLAPLRVWVAEVETVAGQVSIQGGDYEEEALGRVMSHETFADATVRFRYDPQNAFRPALIACTTRHQARSLALHLERHRATGSRAVGVVLGDTPGDERKRILEAFESGEIDTLVQVGVLIEGWSSPRCKLLVDLAPSLSVVRSTQKYFRVMTSHAAQEARIYVLLPTGLPELPVLPTELFGASLREYECGALIGPDRESGSAALPVGLPTVDGVRSRHRIVHRARLEKPALRKLDREATLRVLRSWFCGQAPTSVRALLRSRIDHPWFVGSGSALLRWHGFASTTRGVHRFLSWLLGNHAEDSGLSFGLLDRLETILDDEEESCVGDWEHLERALASERTESTERAQQTTGSSRRRSAIAEGLEAGWRALAGVPLVDSSLDPEAALLEKERRSVARRALWLLWPRQRRIVAREFGLLGEYEQTREESSLLEGVSRAAIGHAIASSVDKMCPPSVRPAPRAFLAALSASRGAPRKAAAISVLPTDEDPDTDLEGFGPAQPNSAGVAGGSTTPAPEPSSADGAPGVAGAEMTTRPTSISTPEGASDNVRPSRRQIDIDLLTSLMIQQEARTHRAACAWTDPAPLYASFRARRKDSDRLDWYALPSPVDFGDLRRVVNRIFARLDAQLPTEGRRVLGAFAVTRDELRLLATAKAQATQVDVSVRRICEVDPDGLERRSVSLTVTICNLFPQVHLVLAGHGGASWQSCATAGKVHAIAERCEIEPRLTAWMMDWCCTKERARRQRIIEAILEDLS